MKNFNVFNIKRVSKRISRGLGLALVSMAFFGFTDNCSEESLENMAANANGHTDNSNAAYGYGSDFLLQNVKCPIRMGSYLYGEQEELLQTFDSLLTEQNQNLIFEFTNAVVKFGESNPSATNYAGNFNSFLFQQSPNAQDHDYVVAGKLFTLAQALDSEERIALTNFIGKLAHTKDFSQAIKSKDYNTVIAKTLDALKPIAARVREENPEDVRNIFIVLETLLTKTQAIVEKIEREDSGTSLEELLSESAKMTELFEKGHKSDFVEKLLQQGRSLHEKNSLIKTLAAFFAQSSDFSQTALSVGNHAGEIAVGGTVTGVATVAAGLYLAPVAWPAFALKIIFGASLASLTPAVTTLFVDMPDEDTYNLMWEGAPIGAKLFYAGIKDELFDLLEQLDLELARDEEDGSGRGSVVLGLVSLIDDVEQHFGELDFAGLADIEAANYSDITEPLFELMQSLFEENKTLDTYHIAALHKFVEGAFDELNSDKCKKEALKDGKEPEEDNKSEQDRVDDVMNQAKDEWIPWATKNWAEHVTPYLSKI